MKIVISSHVSYFPHTFKTLLNSLVAHGVDKSDIIFFIGGAKKSKYDHLEGVDIYYVDYNAFDLTALIGINELSIDSSYFFLLHDTVLIDSLRFNSIVKYYPVSPGYSYSVKSFPSKNIGIYSQEVLVKAQKYLGELKYLSKYTMDLQSLKRYAVESEDVIFKLNADKHKALFPGTLKYIKLKNDPYRKGVVKERIPFTGIVKYTANNKRTEYYKVTF